MTREAGASLVGGLKVIFRQPGNSWSTPICARS